VSRKKEGSAPTKAPSQKGETSKPANSVMVSNTGAQYREILDRAFERFSIIEEALWQRIETAADIADTRAWIEAAYQLRVIAASRAKLKGSAK